MTEIYVKEKESIGILSSIFYLVGFFSTFRFGILLEEAKDNDKFHVAWDGIRQLRFTKNNPPAPIKIVEDHNFFAIETHPMLRAALGKHPYAKTYPTIKYESRGFGRAARKLLKNRLPFYISVEDRHRGRIVKRNLRSPIFFGRLSIRTIYQLFSMIDLYTLIWEARSDHGFDVVYQDDEEFLIAFLPKID